MVIKIGPSGLGPVKDAIENLCFFHEKGMKSCEIAFTHGSYIKKDETIEIKKSAEKLGVILSIHAPYYINLNSKEEEKVDASKKRILDCCEIGHLIGAKNIVFHAGFYSGMEPSEAYENIKEHIKDLQRTVNEKKWDVNLCPEIMGKKNVFGSIDEISRLSYETGCSFCIDFAHVLARYDSKKFSELIKAFPQKRWHCHFSGIVYSKEKGERNHKQTTKEEWKELIKELNKLDKEITIISEAPSPLEDSIVGLEVLGEN